MPGARGTAGLGSESARSRRACARPCQAPWDITVGWPAYLLIVTQFAFVFAWGQWCVRHAKPVLHVLMCGGACGSPARGAGHEALLDRCTYDQCVPQSHVPAMAEQAPRSPGLHAGQFGFGSHAACRSGCPSCAHTCSASPRCWWRWCAGRAARARCCGPPRSPRLPSWGALPSTASSFACSLNICYKDVLCIHSHCSL